MWLERLFQMRAFPQLRARQPENVIRFVRFRQILQIKVLQIIFWRPPQLATLSSLPVTVILGPRFHFLFLNPNLKLTFARPISHTSQNPRHGPGWWPNRDAAFLAKYRRTKWPTKARARKCSSCKPHSHSQRSIAVNEACGHPRHPPSRL